MQYIKDENNFDVPEITFDHPLRCLDSDSIFSYEKYLRYAQLDIQRKFSEHGSTEESARRSLRNQLDVLKQTEQTFSCNSLCRLILSYGFTWQVGDTTYTIPPMEKKIRHL
ncbi:MAG: hypothetical protein JSR80_06965 [Verrucomicrobia bacterium]|nr:hypothetical protein [Verrucomicrobiota bacterium]